MAEALAFPGPALLDVAVNPDEPPMPGKLKFERAKGFAESLLHGQGRKAKMATTLVRDELDELRS